MTKKTASKKKATPESENDAKPVDNPAAEAQENKKPEAKAADKADAKPKAKKKSKPGRKKAAPKVKPTAPPLAGQEQNPRVDKPEPAASSQPSVKEETHEAVAHEPDLKLKPIQQEKEQQKAADKAIEATEPNEKGTVAKSKPKAKRGSGRGPKARGGKKAAKTSDKAEIADKGAEPAVQEAQQGKRVIVASRNPAKIKASELGFSRMFPNEEFIFEGIAVPSGVADQPMTDDETFMGALHRALMAQQEQPNASFWIGLEGGLQEEGDDFYAFAWIVVIGEKGMQGKSRTGTFVLPLEVAELVRDGKELGEADDIIFGKTNSKHSSGAIGILTHGLIDRAEYYAGAVAMSLIPFKNPSLYAVEDTLIETTA